MSELWRKAYRSFGLVFVIAYLFIDKNSLLKILLAILAILVALEFLRFKFPKLTKEYLKIPIAKEKERKNISGTTLFVASVLLSIFFFSKPIAMLSIIFLIVGDAAATLIGTKFGRIILFKGKSFEGSFACFIVCLFLGVLLTTLFEPFFGINLLIIFSGAVAATLAELITIKLGRLVIEDNLTMALAAGLVMSFVAGL